MEALLLLATLGPASCLLGVSAGANLRPLVTHLVIKRVSVWLAATLLAWIVWPSYSANFALWKHMLVYGSVFMAGVSGGIAYAKAVKNSPS
jgi:hypothetical protein